MRHLSLSALPRIFIVEVTLLNLVDALTKRLTSLIIASFVTIALSFSQPPDTLWTKIYGGVYMDCGFSVQQTLDSGFIMTGYTDTTGAGLTDVVLIKTDTAGNTIWIKKYGGASYEEGYEVQQTTDGGYIVVGYTESYGAGNSDVYLLKTNAEGETLWTKTYGGPGPDKGYSVKQTYDNGYVITGNQGSDIYLIKTNSAGDTIWTKTYQEPATAFCSYSVQATRDTGYVITGYKWLLTGDYRDVFLMKINANGDILWIRYYGGSNDDEGHSIQATNDGGYVIAGVTYSFGEAIDVYVIRTDKDGDTLWTKTYGGAFWDQGYSVNLLSNNGYIITGFSYSFGHGDNDVYIIRIDENGDTIWTTTYGGASGDIGYSVQQTFDGGYIIVGHTFSFDPGGDIYLIKTEPDIICIGEQKEAKNLSDLKFVVYPNPTITECNIAYKLLQKTYVNISLFDVTGRLVKKIVNENQNAGIHNRSFDITDLSQGLYFVSLYSYNYSNIRKIILVR